MGVSSGLAPWFVVPVIQVVIGFGTLFHYVYKTTAAACMSPLYKQPAGWWSCSMRASIADVGLENSSVGYAALVAARSILLASRRCMRNASPRIHR